MMNTRKLIEASAIAALYIVITFIAAPISFSQIQVRIAEALTILPVFTPAAIPGLFVGCLLSNLLIGGVGMVDVIVGSLSTLIAATLTYMLRKKYILAPLPPVLINAVSVGIVLNVVLKLPLIESMLFVGIGQVIACYVIGYPLILLLDKHKDTLFLKD